MIDTLEGAEIRTFRDAQELEGWIAQHFDLQAGVWLKIAKKSSGIASVTAAEALDVALCYGWIDGKRKSLDEQFFLQRLTPRRPKSLWSQVNVEKVQALIDAGKMQPSGFAAIEAAKADGRWSQAYTSARNLTVPPDLAAALAQNAKASAFFESLNKAGRFAVVFRITTARTARTRASRLEKLVAMLEDGQTP
jgi:uncharacterized protein YdeI (YjbR/CyaY-like superfamily)